MIFSYEELVRFNYTFTTLIRVSAFGSVYRYLGKDLRGLLAAVKVLTKVRDFLMSKLLDEFLASLNSFVK